MPYNDFRALSSQDFEELVRDLLQAEWDVHLEAFKSGRDKGIDLRYATAPGTKTIVQCKHYVGSGFAKLLAHLRKLELPKVKRLRPRRYVVATSVQLNPDEKDTLIAALRPFVQSSQDIYGGNDLDGLLARHQEVRRAHFKLWLTNTDVIERVLHNAEQSHTDFEVRRILQKLPLFVQSAAFPRAMEMLQREKVLVISGVPGIGKTTLAEMLIYAHINEGYLPAAIQAEITEGRRLFRDDPDAKQVFFYDDFLGQTFLGDRPEYLGRNQDAALIDFMEMVRRSPQSRFILTTREHILRSALQVSERLSRSSSLEERCILELNDYTRGDKARILYNHIYFSDLPQAYKEALLEDDFFLEVIRHEHFNPRLVETFSNYTNLKKVEPGKYKAFVSDTLKSPHHIWTYSFRNQISNSARNVLLCLYSLGDSSEITDLEPAFVSLHRQRALKYGQPNAPGDFRRALQELDGSFLRYAIGTANFINPSIREFIASEISGDRDTVEDLITSSVRFKQITNLSMLGAAQQRESANSSPRMSSTFVFDRLTKLLRGPSLRWEKVQGVRRGYPIDLSPTARVKFLMEAARDEESIALANLADKGTEFIVASGKGAVVDFQAVTSLLEAMGENSWYLDHGGRETYRQLLTYLMEGISWAFAADWMSLLAFRPKVLEWTSAFETTFQKEMNSYQESGASDERLNCSRLDELFDLRDSLRQLSDQYGLEFQSEIEMLDEEIAERREDEPDQPDDDERLLKSVPTARRETMSDDEIRQMFSVFREKD